MSDDSNAGHIEHAAENGETWPGCTNSSAWHRGNEARLATEARAKARLNELFSTSWGGTSSSSGTSSSVYAGSSGQSRGLSEEQRRKLRNIGLIFWGVLIGGFIVKQIYDYIDTKMEIEETKETTERLQRERLAEAEENPPIDGGTHFAKTRKLVCPDVNNGFLDLPAGVEVEIIGRLPDNFVKVFIPSLGKEGRIRSHLLTPVESERVAMPGMTGKEYALEQEKVAPTEEQKKRAEEEEKQKEKQKKNSEKENPRITQETQYAKVREDVYGVFWPMGKETEGPMKLEVGLRVQIVKHHPNGDVWVIAPSLGSKFREFPLLMSGDSLTPDKEVEAAVKREAQGKKVNPSSTQDGKNGGPKEAPSSEDFKAKNPLEKKKPVSMKGAKGEITTRVADVATVMRGFTVHRPDVNGYRTVTLAKTLS